MGDSKKSSGTEMNKNSKIENVSKNFKNLKKEFKVEKFDNDSNLTDISKNNADEKDINGNNEIISKNDENNNKNSNNEITENLPLYDKIKEFIVEDLNKKFPLLFFIGIAIGVFLIIIGIFIFSGNSDRVVDNVSFGETAVTSVLLIFIGFILVIISFLNLFSIKNFFGGTFNAIKDFESDGDNDENEDNEINHNDENDLKSINIDSKSSKSDDNDIFRRTIEIDNENMIISNDNDEDIEISSENNNDSLEDVSSENADKNESEDLNKDKKSNQKTFLD